MGKITEEMPMNITVYLGANEGSDPAHVPHPCAGAFYVFCVSFCARVCYNNILFENRSNVKKAEYII